MPIFNRQRQSGVALLLTLLLIGLLWFTVLSFARGSLVSLKFSSNSLNSERAKAGAEAGLVYVLHRLKEDPAFRADTAPYLMARSKVSFTLRMWNSEECPVAIPPDSYYVLSTGRAPTGQERKVAVVVRFVEEGNALFDHAIFTSTLDIRGGSHVRVFDSSGQGGSLSGKANIGSNSVEAGALRLNSGVTVDGTVFVGPGGETNDTPNQPWKPNWNTDNVVWKNWNAETEGETPLDEEVEFAPVDAPSPGIQNLRVDWRGLDLSPGSYRDLRVNGGGEARLGSGTYVFESIRVSGGGTLHVDGDQPVYIYVRDSLDMSGGSFFNASKKARNLVFLMDDGADVKIRGGTNAYAAFYGPSSEMSISGGNNVYGAVVSDSFSLSGGSEFHYDLGLKLEPPSVPALSGGEGGMEVLGTQQF